MKIVNKRIISIIVILASITIIPLHIRTEVANSTWGVEPLDQFTYILEESTWDLEINDNEKSGSGSTFNDITILKSQPFIVEVKEVDEEWGIDFNVDNSTHNVDDSITNDQFKLEFLNFIYYPYYECKRLLADGFGNAEKGLGPEILGWFFVMPVGSTWNYLSNLTDDTFHNNLPRTDFISGSFIAELETIETDVTFDLRIIGTIENPDNNTNIQFEHIMKFVWDELAGNLLGYRVLTTFSGTFEGVQLSEDMAVICRLSDYQISNFKFQVGFLPGLSYLIAITSILFVTVILIVIRKRTK